MQEPLLNDLEIKVLEEKLKHWELVNGKTKLKRLFKFNNFLEAFAFITKVAIISEKLNHHPEWSNVYNKVTIELITHNVNGLTNLDIKLAEEIENLFS